MLCMLLKRYAILPIAPNSGPAESMLIARLCISRVLVCKYRGLPVGVTHSLKLPVRRGLTYQNNICILQSGCHNSLSRTALVTEDFLNLTVPIRDCASVCSRHPIGDVSMVVWMLFLNHGSKTYTTGPLKEVWCYSTKPVIDLRGLDLLSIRSRSKIGLLL